MSVTLYMDVHVPRAITNGLCLRGVSFTGVIYAHQLKATIGQCIRDLEVLAVAGEPEDFANRVEYLPLR